MNKNIGTYHFATVIPRRVRIRSQRPHDAMLVSGPLFAVPMVRWPGIRSWRPPRRPTQHLVLLFQQFRSPAKVTILGRFGRRDSRLRAVVDICSTEPLRQRQRVDPEIVSDLLERHIRLTVPSDPDNIVTELLGIGLCRE
jgi:hypothetical protein